MRGRGITAVLLTIPLVAIGAQAAASARFLSLAVFTLVPLIASLVHSWRGTVGWALYALAVATPMMLADPTFSPQVDAIRLTSLLPVVGFAVANAVVRERRETRLRDVTAVARVAQAAILRPLPSQVGGHAIEARYHSAARAAQVGGDLYEAVAHRDGARVLVGDARGKGLGAVGVAARTVWAFREAAENPDLALAQVAEAVDRSVSRDLDPEGFVTAIFAELTADGTLRTVNAGHPGPILARAAGGEVDLSPPVPAVPLGLTDLVGSAARPTHEHHLGDGDRVLFFSDGVLDARDRAGRSFPLPPHATRLGDGTVTEAVDRLLDAVTRFAPALSDDVVLLLVERPPEFPSGPAGHLALDRSGHPTRLARRLLHDTVDGTTVHGLLDDTLLVGTELVTNAMVHTTGQAVVQVFLAPDRVRVEVHDDDPDTGLLTPRVPHHGAPSGRGLLIVERLSAHWGVRPASGNGKVVWACLHDGHPAPALSPQELLDCWADEL